MGCYDVACGIYGSNGGGARKRGGGRREKATGSSRSIVSRGA